MNEKFYPGKKIESMSLVEILQDSEDTLDFYEKLRDRAFADLKENEDNIFLVRDEVYETQGRALSDEDPILVPLLGEKEVLNKALNALRKDIVKARETIEKIKEAIEIEKSKRSIH